MAEPDIAKIIDIIMKNPGLVEEIKGLVKENEVTETPDTNITADEGGEQIAAGITSDSPVTEERVQKSERTKRNELLRSLKPYVSSERGRAIESMMSIADILDMMREK